MANLGRVAYVNRGAYNPDSEYEKYDVVFYNRGSYVYINPVASANHLPTNETYWTIMLDATGVTQGIIGYTGSIGSPGGFTGSFGFTGSQGIQGIIGLTGSQSTVIGFTGSQGIIGLTGSQSTIIGYTGSKGYTGSQGIIGLTGSQSTIIGYTGSQGIIGLTGSTSTMIGYTGSKGYVGSASTIVGYTGSIGYAGSSGSPALPVAGSYTNLAALNAANPDHSKIYITLNDGAWCYYNGSAFVAGGTYQATSIADGSVTPAKLYIRGRMGLFYGSTNLLNFDLANSRIIIPDDCGIFIDGTQVGWVVSGPLTIAIPNANVNCFVYNTATNVFEVVGELYVTQDHILIGMCSTYYGYAWANGRYLINGVNFPGYYLSPDYNEAVTKLVVSPHLFLAKGIELPIYKSSIIGTIDRLQQKEVETYFIGEKLDGTPIIKGFNDDMTLNGEDLAATVQIAMRKEVIGTWYSQDIIAYCTDPVNKTQQPKILMIGDSLINRYMPKFTKDKLTALGITSTMHGTMANTGGENGEGRESWTFANYIGRDNVLGPNVINIIVPQPSGSTSDLYKNPFIRLAIAQDKTDHPTWCFSQIGVLNEVSYAEDPNAQTDWYIFDFAYYLANHSVQTPDVITIALGTNDIGKAFGSYNMTGLASCRQGLEIMVKQIKTALPNVKIGVIPSPAWGESGWWKDYIVPWIEYCIADLATFGLSDVYVVPVWMHQQKTFIFPYGETAIDAISLETKNVNTDTVHFGTIGQKQYAEVTAAFIVNMIS